MKKLLAISLLLITSNTFADCENIYATVGAGYKFEEQQHYVFEGRDLYSHPSPYSARIELGVECKYIKFGVSHHSQWSTGAPFNNTGEPYKTEIFIDYTYRWSL